MLIDLSKLFLKDNHTIKINVEIVFDQFHTKFGVFSITEKAPVALELSHKTRKAFTVKGFTALHLEIPCDRCLEPVDYKMNLSFEKKFDLEKAALHLEQEDTEERLYVTEDEQLDVRAILEDEMLIAWPSKVLCRDDCKGICKVCGHNLNVSDCGCDRDILDPRMAAIQDIFKNANKQP